MNYENLNDIVARGEQIDKEREEDYQKGLEERKRKYGNIDHYIKVGKFHVLRKSALGFSNYWVFESDINTSHPIFTDDLQNRLQSGCTPEELSVLDPEEFSDILPKIPSMMDRVKRLVWMIKMHIIHLFLN